MNAAEHTITTTLDPQRGGWFSVCSCGWQEPRPCWYKKRSLGRAAAHLVEVGS